jgi:anti-sigma regulatory factor (Ser/Thr protein kinase)
MPANRSPKKVLNRQTLVSLHLGIAPIWPAIEDVRNEIETLILNLDKGNIDFALIVLSELLENAIKYGSKEERLTGIILYFEANVDHICIKVKNPISQSMNLDSFKRVIEKIKTSEDKKALHVERLLEIMNDPFQTESRLGLYRIVSECEYDLDFRLDDSGLEIIATKILKASCN